MSRTVGGANTVSTIKHSGDKDKAIARVAGAVRPGAPDFLVRRVGQVLYMRHDRANENRDKHTTQDQKHAQVANVWQEPIHEKDNNIDDISNIGLNSGPVGERVIDVP